MINKNQIGIDQLNQSILHRSLNDPPQVLVSCLTYNIPDAGGKIQHTALWQGTLHERVNVPISISKRLETARQAEVVKEARDGFVQMRADGAIR
jgi:hypothetical protein